ncbi:MAG: thioredoxin domain protein [Candidatus Nomurabacteria bacterium]|nr:thioredoxin domain protein [Candidatus Nomurabacteria bacterium]
MKKLSHFLSTSQGKFIGLIVLLIVVLFIYYFYAMSNNTNSAPVGEPSITETDHVRGNLAGTVTLVEFGDFQCPACGAYEPLVRQITKDNGDILKVVFKHFPLTQLHQNALIAAKASEAASIQGKFWEMHDILYDKQAEWQGSLNARDMFLTYAATLGLDAAKFQADINSTEVENKVLSEYKEGLSLKVNSTPTFFVNGKKINNPQSVQEFNGLIRASANGAVQ